MAGRGTACRAPTTTIESACPGLRICPGSPVSIVVSPRSSPSAIPGADPGSRGPRDPRRGPTPDRGTATIDALRPPFRRELAKRLYHLLAAPDGIDETTPGTSAVTRLEQARAEIVEACDGFLAREAIRASLTADERREILRGMVLTRAVDNRLKQLFMGGEVRWGERAFQGKGFRSLGQEAIYAGAIPLRTGVPPRRRRGDRRRARAGHSRPRDDAGHAARRGGHSPGAQRADGQGRSARSGRLMSQSSGMPARA
jgi:hypothetical protein